MALTRIKMTSVVAGLSVLAGVSACAPNPVGPTEPGPTVPAHVVEVPTIPLPPAAAWAVTRDGLDLVNCTECDNPDGPNEARFFYGTLPLGSVDALVASHDADSLTTRSILGNLHASGYFGGVYLRSSLAGEGADPAAAVPFAPVLDLLGGATQSVVDQFVADLVRVATTGTDQEVRAASTTWAAIHAAIIGYNRGYLDVALDNPPAGVSTGPELLTCVDTFSCSSALLPMTSLEQLAPQAASLAQPTSLEWLAAKLAVNTIADQARPGGADVWRNILANAEFDAQSYTSIIELSVGFLQATQVALLGTLAGPTGGNIAVARQGLLSSAALVTWIGSYFMGLASPLSNTTLPSLNCP